MNNNSSIMEVDKNIHQVALSHLARREYTRFMLKEKLRQKGFLLQSIEIALDILRTASS